MKLPTLYHKALRDLWLMRGQALAIALGVQRVAILVISVEHGWRLHSESLCPS